MDFNTKRKVISITKETGVQKIYINVDYFFPNSTISDVINLLIGCKIISTDKNGSTEIFTVNEKLEI